MKKKARCGALNINPSLLASQYKALFWGLQALSEGVKGSPLQGESVYTFRPWRVNIVLQIWLIIFFLCLPLIEHGCLSKVVGNRMGSVKRLLVVEDDEIERSLLFNYLQHLGYRVFLANDGLDGIHKAKLVQPDLILMDFDMPQCSGLDACRILASDEKLEKIPVIFLSAHAASEQRVRGLQAGGVDYVAKPFDFDELKLRIAVHLNACAAPPQGEMLEMETEEKSHSASVKNRPARLESIIFNSARIYLLKDLAVTPEMSWVAEKVGSNSKTINQAFRHCTGMTAFEYLREERMKEAEKLVRNTDYSVIAIAEQLGFSSGANFSTAFRKRYGCSPAQYRDSGSMVKPA